MLEPYRVLDLTNEWGLMAGSMLADLGADVIQVEPPGGSGGRRQGPFVRGRDDPEASLFWWSYARNKRGILLDIQSEEGKAKFIELVKGAEVLIESYKPGFMAGIGLGFDDLAQINPGLVFTSITPFGQTGPKALWPACDLTTMSAGGYQRMSGDEDRAPLRIAVPQAHAHASMEAVVGTLIALQSRRQCGLGQHVDVSALEAAGIGALGAHLAIPWNDDASRRTAAGFQIGQFHFPQTYPAKDGFVSITFFFGDAIGPATKRLIDWMYEEGACDVSIRDKDYVAYGALLLSGQEPASELTRITDAIAAFTATKTKAELFGAATGRGVLVAPISSIADVRHDPHLASRGFWQSAAPGEPDILYPGPFAQLGEDTPRSRRRAPRLGEHNAEILSRPARQSVLPPVMHVRPPFEGLNVMDLGWVMVEPSVQRVLCDYGATVVKVESTRRVDTARTLRPMKDRIPGPDRCGPFHTFNAGKLGLSLDLSQPSARDVIRRMAKWADVLGESFTPRAMRAWGLHYEALREINPRLIYVSSCLGGQTGLYSQLAGYGNHGAALAGFNNLCGWGDRPPAGPSGPYTDFVAPKFIAAALIAAIDQRERTGAGVHIDVSQFESSVHFLTPAMLDYEVNGEVLAPDGNRDPGMCPHGVFPCAGDDQWVAIAAADEGQWLAFCRATGQPELIDDARFATFAARKVNEDLLESTIADWTRLRSVEEVQQILVNAGVACHGVSDPQALFEDPQLRHRDHLVNVQHRELGEVVIENARYRLNRTPARMERAGPTYGEHAHYVLTELLGYSSAEVAEFAAEGILE